MECTCSSHKWQNQTQIKNAALPNKKLEKQKTFKDQHAHNKWANRQIDSITSTTEKIVVARTPAV